MKREEPRKTLSSSEILLRKFARSGFLLGGTFGVCLAVPFFGGNIQVALLAVAIGTIVGAFLGTFIGIVVGSAVGVITKSDCTSLQRTSFYRLKMILGSFFIAFATVIFLLVVIGAKFWVINITVASAIGVIAAMAANRISKDPV